MGAALCRAAHAYRESRRYEKAIRDYSDAIRLEVTKGNQVYCYWGRGLCYAAMRDFSKAIADYTEAGWLDPKFVGAFHDRAMAYKEIGENEKAEADLKCAADIGYGPPKKGSAGSDGMAFTGINLKLDVASATTLAECILVHSYGKSVLGERPWKTTEDEDLITIEGTKVAEVEGWRRAHCDTEEKR